MYSVENFYNIDRFYIASFKSTLIYITPFTDLSNDGSFMPFFELVKSFLLLILLCGDNSLISNFFPSCKSILPLSHELYMTLVEGTLGIVLTFNYLFNGVLYFGGLPAGGFRFSPLTVI